MSGNFSYLEKSSIKGHLSKISMGFVYKGIINCLKNKTTTNHYPHFIVINNCIKYHIAFKILKIRN